MEESLQITIPRSVRPTLELPDPELLTFYEDRENRIIWLLGEVGDLQYDQVAEILRYNRQDKAENLKPELRKPIKIIINSPGGGLEEAKMLCEIIALSETPIWGFAIGQVASAASLIYLSCHRRFATKNAYFLFHRGSCGNIGGDYNQINQFMEDYKKQINELEDFYTEHTNFTPEYIKEKFNGGDWYIYINEALEKGICNKIIDDIEILL